MLPTVTATDLSNRSHFERGSQSSQSLQPEVSLSTRDAILQDRRARASTSTLSVGRRSTLKPLPPSGDRGNYGCGLDTGPSLLYGRCNRSQQSISWERT